MKNAGIGEITGIKLPYRKMAQDVRQKLAEENYDPKSAIKDNLEIINNLSRVPFKIIGQKLSKGELLDFEEAFMGMVYVTAATNRLLFGQLKGRFKEAHGLGRLYQHDLRGPAQSFLTTMALRSRLSMLIPEEVAGMVAAALMDLSFRLDSTPYLLEIGGMGGDKGIIYKGKRTRVINASTLSAVVLSSLGIFTLKHGGYANTSVVGAVETIEYLGVNIYQSSVKDIEALLNATNFYFNGTHIAKTMHDLTHSHLGKYETIMHLIGPMTLPISKKTVLHKILGINECADPEVIAKAYEILKERGYLNVGNVIIVSGLGRHINRNINYRSHKSLIEHMCLDEMSPFTTILNVIKDGKYKGMFKVRPSDFGTTIDQRNFLENKKDVILSANENAIKGRVSYLSDYLALNSAIGLFACEYLPKTDAILGDGLNKKYLKECFRRCSYAINSGNAFKHLEKIRVLSNSLYVN